MPFFRGKKIKTLKAKRSGLKSEAAHSGGRCISQQHIKKMLKSVSIRKSVLACNA